LAPANALACLQLGRAAAAWECLAALAALGPLPAALTPLWRWRLVLLALVEGRPDDARREAEQLDAELTAVGQQMTPEHAIMGRFDLAKFWSSHNDSLRAMAQWTHGHKWLAKSQPFSREEHRAFVDAQIAAFDRARLNGGPRGLAALLFPRAKIIRCRRDPRDIGLSIFTFRFHGAHGYAHDLADLGWYIGEHQRLMAHWKAALPNCVLEVKLSD
jgi:hypothetical protein